MGLNRENGKLLPARSRTGTECSRAHNVELRGLSPRMGGYAKNLTEV